MNRATPLITVDAIEPVVPFWTERLGFTLTMTVPHEDTIGFAMLHHGDVELMYQTRASVAADLGASGAPDGLADEMASGTSAIFMQTDRDMDELVAALGDTEVVVPRRTTFYGMEEIFVRPPCGTVVGLARKVDGAEDEGEGPGNDDG